MDTSHGSRLRGFSCVAVVLVAGWDLLDSSKCTCSVHCLLYSWLGSVVGKHGTSFQPQWILLLYCWLCRLCSPVCSISHMRGLFYLPGHVSFPRTALALLKWEHLTSMGDPLLLSHWWYSKLTVVVSEFTSPLSLSSPQIPLRGRW